MSESSEFTALCRIQRSERGSKSTCMFGLESRRITDGLALNEEEEEEENIVQPRSTKRC